MERQQIIQQYVTEKMIEIGDQQQIAAWVVTIIEQSKADTKNAIITWMDAKKTELRAEKSGLEAIKTSREQSIDAEVAKLDSVTI